MLLLEKRNGYGKKISFGTHFRVLGMSFILMCHFVQESGNAHLAMTAQSFNIGVGMFIILSGFLYGMKFKSGGYCIPHMVSKENKKNVYSV